MTSPTQGATFAEEPRVVFRASKKRKANIRRIRDEDTREDIAGAADANTAEGVAAVQESEEEDGQGLSVAEALRLRNARKAKLNGVGFTAQSASGGGPDGENENDERSVVLKEESRPPKLGGMTQRFARQTGMVGELVNKHMEEYIESELAKRYSAHSPSKQPNEPPTTKTTTQDPHHPSAPTGSAQPRVAAGQQAMQGKLMEIDLGAEARARNVSLTERALSGASGAGPDAEPDARPPRKKPRLGRDGKPWRPRNRRTSDDVERDRMVEAVLRENRLDVYELPAAAGPPSPGGEGGDEDAAAADDRVAEEFRREFLDAMAQRQQRRRRAAAPPAPANRPGARNDGEVLKGPKLGGSRNVRAQMRDLLLKKEKEGKK